MGYALAMLFALQDPVAFEPRAAAKDRMVIEVESGLTIEVRTDDAEGEKKRILSWDRRESFRQEVLDADRGRARRLRVACTASSLRKSVEGKPPRGITTGLAGRAFLVEVAEAPKVTVEGGGPVPGEADMLGAWELYPRLLPSGSKKPGDVWEVESKDLGRLLWAKFEGTSGKVTVRFEKREGDRASLLLGGEIGGKTKEGFEGKITLGETRLVFDLKKGRPVSLRFTGGVALSKKIVDRRPKPGSLTEEIETSLGEVNLKSTRFTLTVSFS